MQPKPTRLKGIKLLLSYCYSCYVTIYMRVHVYVLATLIHSIYKATLYIYIRAQGFALRRQAMKQAFARPYKGAFHPSDLVSGSVAQNKLDKLCIQYMHQQQHNMPIYLYIAHNRLSKLHQGSSRPICVYMPVYTVYIQYIHYISLYRPIYTYIRPIIALYACIWPNMCNCVANYTIRLPKGIIVHNTLE